MLQLKQIELRRGTKLLFENASLQAHAGQRMGIIGVNGAAARLVQKDDLVIICAYAKMKAKQAQDFKPTVLLMDEKNRVKEIV